MWPAAGYGLAVGLGTILLAKPVNLNDEPITKTKNAKVLTGAWYVLGGIIIATAIKKLAERSNTNYLKAIELKIPKCFL